MNQNLRLSHPFRVLSCSLLLASAVLISAVSVNGQALPPNLFNPTILTVNSNSETIGIKVNATSGDTSIGTLLDANGTPHALIYYAASNQYAFLLAGGPSEALAMDGTNYGGYENIVGTVGSLPSLANCAIWNDASAVLANSTFEEFPQKFIPAGYTDAWIVGMDTNATPVGTAHVKINDAIPAGGDGSIIEVQEAQSAFVGDVDLGCGTGQTLTGVPFGCFTRARGARGGEQVGEASGGALGSALDSSPEANPFSHAVVWHGTAASMVDLNPNGYHASSALATDGSHQGGYAMTFDGQSHAMIWSGTSASAVDLHPTNYFDTRVSGMCSQYQVGDGWVGGPANSPGATQHGLLWTGSAGSVIDLNQFLPSGYVNFTITGVDPQGDISGYARLPFGSAANANTFIGIILKPNPTAGLASFTLDSASATSGQVVNGTVTLQAPAPAGGVTINFSSDNNSLVTAPPDVFVPEGQTSVSFPVPTNPNGFTAAPAPVRITAHLFLSAESATLPVSSPPPAGIASVEIAPASVMSEYSFQVTVTLTSPALLGGVPIALASSDPQLAPIPPTFSIPAGAISATYSAASGLTNVQTTATITATFNGTTASNTFTVTPANPVTSLVMTPSVIAPGDTVNATVTLAAPAPSGGQIIFLDCDNSTLLPSPQNVVVPEGQSSVTFPIATKFTLITAPVAVTLRAGPSPDNVSGQVIFSPIVRLVSLTSTSGFQGNTLFTATLTLSYPPQSPLSIALSSSNLAVNSLPSVTVPAGQTSVTFNYLPMAVPVTSEGLLSATAVGMTVSAPVVVAASPQPTITEITVPSSVLSGQAFLGTLALSGPALLGGAPISLAGDNPAAVAFSSTNLFIPAGSTSITFSGTAATVEAVTTDNLTATFNGLSTPPTPLTIVPAISSFTLAPYSMIGPGVQTTGTVTLAQPAPAGGITVTISPASSQSERFPSTLAIPAGQTSGRFTLQGNSVSGPVSTTFTVAFQGVANPPAGATSSALLTVAPTDTLHVTKATWSQSTHLLTVTATSTNPQSIINVLNANGNVYIGTMNNLGSGTYSFQTTITSTSSVNIKSNLGGSTGQGVAIVQ